MQPVDADGAPIEVGDTLVFADMDPAEVGTHQVVGTIAGGAVMTLISAYTVRAISPAGRVCFHRQQPCPGNGADATKYRLYDQPQGA